jgi:hypothetical protein
VVLILILPGTVPLVAHWVRTFPASGGDGLPSDTVWWTVVALSVAAVAASVSERRLPGRR